MATRCAIIALFTVASAQPLYPLVDTLIGTGGFGYGIGGSPPGAQLPFGALRLSPDTSLGPAWFFFSEFGGYHYDDTSIRAFSHTHMVGSGASDFGNFGIMHTRWFNESVYTDSAHNSNYRSRFSKATEASMPGYYTAYLEDAETLAEVVAVSTHSGIHRYTCFPRGAPSDRPCIVILDVCHTTSKTSDKPCAFANVTLVSNATDGGVLLAASVLNHGGLSGRGPLGGVYVHLVANISVRTVNSSATLLAPQSSIWSNNSVLPTDVTSAESDSGSLGAQISFAAAGGSSAVLELTIRVGLSFIDPAHAVDNLRAAQQQPQGWVAFDDAVDGATAVWETYVSRAEVVGEAEAAAAVAAAGAGLPPAARARAYKLARNTSGFDPQLISFASTVYRAFKAPTNYTEPCDGSYMGLDGAVHTAAPGAAFLSDLSEWDIARTQASWLALLAPDVSVDLTNTLVAMAVQHNRSGELPRWPIASVEAGCMTGSHGVVILSDAVVKGVPGVNAPAILATVTAAVASEDGSNEFNTYGYVPIEASNTAASDTLEWSWDAGIASGLASFLGDAALSAQLWNTSQSYRRVWDPSDKRHIFCPKTAAGEFKCPLDAALPYFLDSGGYVEGNALQYQAFVPHDMFALVNELYPSPAVFAATLEDFHNKSIGWALNTTLPNPYWWPGNEPDLLAPWSFVFAGNQYATRTQHWVRWTLETYYVAEPRGLPGNDDYGEMSAWAAFGLLGLYPMAGTQTYVLGVPAFANATLALPPSALRFARDSAKSEPLVLLSIVAHNFSAVNIWAYRATINGADLPTPFVNHSQLVPPVMYRPHTLGSKVVQELSIAGAAASAPAMLEFWLCDVELPWGSTVCQG